MQGITFQDIKKRLVLVDESADAYNNIREYNRSIIEYYETYNKRPDDILNKIKEGCQANFTPPIDSLLRLYNTLCTHDKSSVGHIRKAYKMISEYAIPKYSKNIFYGITVLEGACPIATIPEIGEPITLKSIACKEGYKAFYSQALLNESCYRIINNYNKLSKRFNIDNLLRENTYRNGVYDSIVELCRLIDTYKIPLKVKVNAALESSYFGLNSAHIDFDKSDIVQAVVDYFGNRSNGLKTCSKLLEDSQIYEPKDIPREIEIIHEEEPEDENNNIEMEIESYISKKDPINYNLPIKESKNFDNIFSKWKVMHESDKFNSLEELISVLFSGNVPDAVDNSIKLLIFIKTMIVLDPSNTDRYINAIYDIGRYFIENYIDKPHVISMINKFLEIISLLNIKINNSYSEEEKNNLEKYRDACEKVLDTIKSHYNDIEIDNKFESDYDDNFLENAVDLLSLCNLMEQFQIIKEKSVFPYVELSFLKSIGSDNALLIAEFVNKYRGCYNVEDVLSLYESYYNSLSIISYKDRANMKDSLNLLRSKVSEFEYSGTIYESYYILSNMVEGMNCIQDMVYNQQLNTPLTEASFLNNLKTISYNLKKKMKDMSEKEKTLSRKFDTYMNLFAKKARDSMMNDNRESIIKGSVIPSASKTFKLVLTAIVGGALVSTSVAAAQVAGVIAIIRVLAYFVCSGKLQAAQRQELIDEIEIELKMCDKYIEEAEAKNDKEALRQLYKIQRTLHRQNQRCKHHMRIVGQTVHDVPHAGEY